MGRTGQPYRRDLTDRNSGIRTEERVSSNHVHLVVQESVGDGISCRVLDDSDHPRRHEAGCAHLCPGTGNFGYLDGATHVGHLDPPASPPGGDFEPFCYRAAHVDEHLDAVTFHENHRNRALISRGLSGLLSALNRQSGIGHS